MRLSCTKRTLVLHPEYLKTERYNCNQSKTIPWIQALISIKSSFAHRSPPFQSRTLHRSSIQEYLYISRCKSLGKPTTSILKILLAFQAHLHPLVDQHLRISGSGTLLSRHLVRLRHWKITRSQLVVIMHQIATKCSYPSW
jgi:hypothetical protein